ncbi:MAG TPA: hypothetical protein VLQ80_02320 [Candidatus Saccharimonadia bacterium]|nr:hypothetical protein [Candidatus Saccharimonadia bacterium]
MHIFEAQQLTRPLDRHHPLAHRASADIASPIPDRTGMRSTQAHHGPLALGERLWAIVAYDLVRGSPSDSLVTPERSSPHPLLDQVLPCLEATPYMVRP